MTSKGCAGILRWVGSLVVCAWMRASRLPINQRFYLLGAYDNRGLWRNIYLGKAGFGNTANLRARILEELKDERCFLWRAGLSPGNILAAGKRHYGGRYNWDRPLRKEGTTHIVWVTSKNRSNDDVVRIEADLIEAMNPTANIQRPVPPRSLQTDTGLVFTVFREKIHANRRNPFRVNLA